MGGSRCDKRWSSWSNSGGNSLDEVVLHEHSDRIVELCQLLRNLVVHLPIEVEMGDLQGLLVDNQSSGFIEVCETTGMRTPVVIGDLGDEFVSGREDVDVSSLTKGVVG